MADRQSALLAEASAGHAQEVANYVAAYFEHAGTAIHYEVAGA